MEKIKIILIGVGSMGKNHLRLLQDMDSYDLVAVVEPNPEFKCDCTRYTSIDECLEKEDFQAAVVATPVTSHYEIGKKLLDNNINLYMEKPFAADSIKAQELFDLAQKKSLNIFVGHSERYNPAFLLFMEKMNEGITGELYRLESNRVGPYPQRVGDTGVALDLAVHDLDAINAVMKTCPQWIFSYAEQRINPKFEDGILSILGYENVICRLTVNWLSPRKQRILNAYGRDGMLQCNFFKREVKFFENCYQRKSDDEFGIGGIEAGQEITYDVADKEPLKIELEVFANQVNNSQNDIEALKSAINVIKLVDRILESAKIGNKLEFKC